MRELNSREYQKIELISKLLDAYEREFKKTIWGNAKSLLINFKYRKEIMLESMKTYIMFSKKDIQEELDDAFSEDSE